MVGVFLTSAEDADVLTTALTIKMITATNTPVKPNPLLERFICNSYCYVLAYKPFGMRHHYHSSNSRLSKFGENKYLIK